MFVTFQSLGFSPGATFRMLRAFFVRPKCLTNSCGRTLCARTPQNNQDSVKVLAREDVWLKRKVREAIEIKIGQPAMNGDQGHELPHLR